MAFCLFGAKPLHESKLFWVIFLSLETNQWKLNQNTDIFREDDAFDNLAFDKLVLIFFPFCWGTIVLNIIIVTMAIDFAINYFVQVWYNLF